MKNGKQRILRIALLSIGGLALAVSAAVSAYMIWERAPAVETPAPSSRPVKSEPKVTAAPKATETPWPAGRQKGVYTILLVGNDDGNGNTDTIMVGRLDTAAHAMDFVSIPRDTLINWDWEIRKINAVYWSYRLMGETGIDQLMEHVGKLTGFQPDCYAVLDIGVFIQAVDALGGVDFDVPMDLDYEDRSQDLYIHIPAGPQHLSGEEAMGVCRYRSGYYNGDLGRIDMQHRFLKACAEQLIDLGNIPNLSKVVELLSGGLDTDLSAANIAFFLRQALLCDSEDVNFYTMPNTDDTVHALSYTLVELDPWLEMINAHLNPYLKPVTAEDLDVVYRQGGSYLCTTELQAPWYFSWQPSTPARPQTVSEPEPEPESTQTPLFQLPEFTFPPLPGEGETAPAPEEKGELVPALGG